MLSVLIPVYRVPLPWFQEALASVDQALDFLEAQRPAGDAGGRPEVLLVVDGSDQQDLLAFLAHRARDPRTRVVHCRENLGVAGALNVGLNECRYELVARFDADDIMIQQRLAAQYAAMQADPKLDCLGTNANLYWLAPDGWAVDPTNTDFPAVVTREVALARLNFMHHPTVMYRKSSVVRAGGYDASLKGYSEDHDLWVRMLLCGMSLRNLRQIFHLHRVHPGSASSLFNPANDEFLLRSTARLREGGPDAKLPPGPGSQP